MVKPLSFKGDKKPKKRKRTTAEKDDHDDDPEAPSSKQLTTLDDAAAADDDETWVSADTTSDISGPILLILPTDPVSCLAVDQFGKIFSSKIENLVENEASTAEPHDVRQVWICQKIVGMEGMYTFKGHHGRYLGCDEVGFLSAAREAVSPEETFKVRASETSGLFDIANTRGEKTRYIAVDNEKTPVEIRGDADEAGEGITGVRVRMQARFKPRHKVEKAEKVRAKISRKELEDEVGRRLDDGEVKKLKKARREGNYHEAMLDVKVKGKHDKFA